MLTEESETNRCPTFLLLSYVPASFLFATSCDSYSAGRFQFNFLIPTFCSAAAGYVISRTILSSSITSCYSCIICMISHNRWGLVVAAEALTIWLVVGVGWPSGSIAGQLHG